MLQSDLSASALPFLSLTEFFLTIVSHFPILPSVSQFRGRMMMLSLLSPTFLVCVSVVPELDISRTCV